MAITDAWTVPTDNEIDLDNGDLIGESTFDKLGSDLLWLYNRIKILGRAKQTVNQTITSTASPGTDVTGLSVTCTPPGTTDVKITVSMPNVSVDAAQTTSVAIQKDGVIICTWTTNLSRPPVHFVHVDELPTNAAHTYKVSMWSGAAQNIKTINGDGTAPTNWIIVERCGT